MDAFGTDMRDAVGFQKPTVYFGRLRYKETKSETLRHRRSWQKWGGTALQYGSVN